MCDRPFRIPRGCLLSALALCLPLRANKLAALLAGWVTNPLTVVPITVAQFWCGSLVLPMPISMEELRTTATTLAEQGSFTALAALGAELLWTLIIGSLMVDTLKGFKMSYPPLNIDPNTVVIE